MPDALPDATTVIGGGPSLLCKHILARQRGPQVYGDLNPPCHTAVIEVVQLFLASVVPPTSHTAP
jgi:hypothetical protein